MRRLFLIFTLLCAGIAHAQVPPMPSTFVVKVAYIIPSDRKPAPNYQAKITRVMRIVQEFFADQMEANGFGRMTFTLDQEPNGQATVDLVRSALTTKQFVGSGPVAYSSSQYTNNASEALKMSGINPMKPGVLRVCFMETQDLSPEGDLKNDMSVGSPGPLTGITMMASIVLEVSDPATIRDNRQYEGMILPGIGAAKLVSHKSFPNVPGLKLSRVAAVYLAAVAHEMCHAMGASHCGRPDTVLNGSVMAGFWGMRGYLMPTDFPVEDCRLDRACAALLQLSPFMRKPQDRVMPGDLPQVSILTPPGPMKMEGAKLKIRFSAAASRGPGIALATLENGTGVDGVGVVEYKEYPNYPPAVEGTFETTFIVPDKENRWRVCVWDAAGIGRDAFVTLKAPSDDSIGPKPGLLVNHSRVAAGTAAHFQAILPTQKRELRYEWDFGDGTTGEGMEIDHLYQRNGLYEVKLRAIGPVATGLSSIFINVQSAAPTDKVPR